MKLYLPQTTYYKNYKSLLDSNNLLIAGTIGSGKSVALNGVICTALRMNFPSELELYLMDPKRVELSQYKQLDWFVKGYAKSPESCLKMLRDVERITRDRFREMERKGIKKYDGKRIIVAIDELADLMISDKAKEIRGAIQRIMQIGRAAKVSIFACTQCPNRRIIPAEITLNFDNKLALRCVSPIESRQIVQVAGAERLPRYGYGMYLSPEGLDTEFIVPYISDEYIEETIKIWTKQM